MPWRIFYSYSHRDVEYRDRLATYLAPLKQQNKIVEWYDRKVGPGADWAREISDHLDSADLILLLVSEDFLASEYCFGVELERALARLKHGGVKLVPVLLRPCLWQESRFSELQFVPRGARPVTSWTSREEALVEVAGEIRSIVSEPAPAPASSKAEAAPDRGPFDASLDPVRAQVLAHARWYERTRQRLPSSDDRTRRMEQIFAQMRGLATASYPLLAELARSPSPGERLAAVAILEAFASEQYLPFLVDRVASERPFVSYHAIRALRFAVTALDPAAHPVLLEAIERARSNLATGPFAADSDRKGELESAEQELREHMELLGASAASGGRAGVQSQ